MQVFRQRMLQSISIDFFGYRCFCQGEWGVFVTQIGKCSLVSAENIVFTARCSFSSTGTSLQRLFICSNRVVQVWFFIVSETQPHCPNTYLHGRTTLVRIMQAFVLTAVIISGLNCTVYFCTRVALLLCSPPPPYDLLGSNLEKKSVESSGVSSVG